MDRMQILIILAPQKWGNFDDQDEQYSKVKVDFVLFLNGLSENSYILGHQLISVFSLSPLRISRKSTLT